MDRMRADGASANGPEAQGMRTAIISSQNFDATRWRQPFLMDSMERTRAQGKSPIESNALRGAQRAMDLSEWTSPDEASTVGNLR